MTQSLIMAGEQVDNRKHQVLRTDALLRHEIGRTLSVRDSLSILISKVALWWAAPPRKWCIVSMRGLFYRRSRPRWHTGFQLSFQAVPMSLTGVWMNELRSVLVLREHEDRSLTGQYRSMVGRDPRSSRCLAGRAR